MVQLITALTKWTYICLCVMMPFTVVVVRGSEWVCSTASTNSDCSDCSDTITQVTANDGVLYCSNQPNAVVSSDGKGIAKSESSTNTKWWKNINQCQPDPSNGNTCHEDDSDSSSDDGDDDDDDDSNSGSGSNDDTSEDGDGDDVCSATTTNDCSSCLDTAAVVSHEGMFYCTKDPNAKVSTNGRGISYTDSSDDETDTKWWQNIYPCEPDTSGNCYNDNDNGDNDDDDDDNNSSKSDDDDKEEGEDVCYVDSSPSNTATTKTSDNDDDDDCSSCLDTAAVVSYDGMLYCAKDPDATVSNNGKGIFYTESSDDETNTKFWQNINPCKPNSNGLCHFDKDDDKGGSVNNLNVDNNPVVPDPEVALTEPETAISTTDSSPVVVDSEVPATTTTTDPNNDSSMDSVRDSTEESSSSSSSSNSSSTSYSIGLLLLIVYTGSSTLLSLLSSDSWTSFLSL